MQLKSGHSAGHHSCHRAKPGVAVPPQGRAALLATALSSNFIVVELMTPSLAKPLNWLVVGRVIAAVIVVRNCSFSLWLDKEPKSIYKPCS